MKQLKLANATQPLMGNPKKKKLGGELREIAL